MGVNHAYAAMRVTSEALMGSDKLGGALTTEVGLGAALAAADILSTADASREEAKAIVTKAVDIIYSFREQVIEPTAKAAAALGEAMATGDAAKIGAAVKALMAAQAQAGKALREPVMTRDAKAFEEAVKRADALADEIVAKVAKDDEEGA